MTKQRNAIRAGIFILASLVMILFVIIAISGTSRLTQSWQTYQVKFDLKDDVGGLRPGDDVRIGGLKVGSVKEIEIHPVDNQPNPIVLLTFSIPKQYQLHTDANVAVQTQFTGVSILNIDDFGSAQLLTENDTLQGHPALFSSIGRQLANANIKGMVTEFTNTAGAAHKFIDDAHGRLDGVIDRYNGVTDSAKGMLDSVHEMVGPSTQDFHGTMANLHDITSTVKGHMPDILDSAQSVLHKVNDAAARVDDIAGSARSIIVTNRSKLDSMIASLKTTSDNLKAASMEIRHSPWRLLYKPGPGEMANLNIYDSMRQFADGAASLDDAAGAVRDAMQDKNLDEAKMRDLMQKLNDSFNHFQDVEQKLWKEVKE